VLSNPLARADPISPFLSRREERRLSLERIKPILVKFKEAQAAIEHNDG
jgi:hypothetical protein